MKAATPIQGALIGFSGGLAILVATLALEVYARGLPVQGGLLRLQLESVAVWVLESMPVLLAGAAYVVMSPPDPRPELSVSRPRTTLPSDGDPPKLGASEPPKLLALPGPTASSASGGSGSGPAVSAPPPPPPSVPAFTTVSGPLPSQTTPSGGGGLTPPPPLPSALRQQNLLGQSGADPRVRALQELVKALKDTAARASEESFAKSAMLTNLTQELRAPLSEIVGVTEMLSEETPQRSSPDLESDLNRVAVAGRGLVEIINEILDLSRIEVGQLALVLEDVDLAQVLEEIRASMDASPRLSVHLDPRARMARGDHMRVRQILLTLVRDGLEVSDSGPVTVTIETGARNAVEIRVRDSGPGLTEGQLDRLLDHHPSKDLARQPNERRGLGLALGRRLAELMGGSLTGRSDGVRGCEFRLRLEVARMPAHQWRPRSTLALNERLGGMRLVLVDAEPASRPLATYLSRAGLQIDHVGTAAKALAACQPQPPELAIVDVGLSGAWEVVEQMLGVGVRVVVTSLHDEDVEPALQRGVTAFLVRPVDRKLALATLERCLDD